MFEFLKPFFKYLFGLSSYLYALIGGIWGNSLFAFYAIKTPIGIKKRILSVALLFFSTVIIDIFLYISVKYLENNFMKNLFGKFSKEKLDQVKWYINKYGYYCVLFYRFIPFFRMIFLFSTSVFFDTNRFIIYNIIGAIVWISVLYIIFMTEPWKIISYIYPI